MIKIALTGPECSGKTTLAIELAKALKVNWIPEFARHYITKLNRPYNQEDLDVIALRQQNAIDLIVRIGKDYLITDTEMLVIKIWSQEKFNTVSNQIESLYQQQDFDLIVLCKPDIPYEEDPLRENQEDRDRLFEIYKSELEKSEQNFIIVDSTISTRLNKVLAAIEKL